MEISVIMEARFIPEDTVVTKINGEKTYIVKSSIKIWGDFTKEIKADPNTRFLLGNDGTITAISASTKLCWTLLADDFLPFLENFCDDSE